jgi:hypothetical protein
MMSPFRRAALRERRPVDQNFIVHFEEWSADHFLKATPNLEHQQVCKLRSMHVYLAHVRREMLKRDACFWVN